MTARSGPEETREATARSFSAVLLAGGRSRRMGRDKARLECGGRTLIERQAALLRALAPAECFLAARAPDAYPDVGLPVLADAFPGQGPLAGIERALAVARQPLVLVLAVDLPRLTASRLRQLLAAGGETTGVVPRVAGRFEPLAAVYPKSAHALAAARLDAGQNRARAFAVACVERGWARPLDLPPEAANEFVNWNTPGDAARAPVA